VNRKAREQAQERLIARFGWSAGLIDNEPMPKSDLLRSHDELRTALVIAGKEIRKLTFGRADSPVLKKLRQVLREARAVAKIRKRETPRALSR